MSGLYPGMDDVDDLLKEYNKSVEGNPNVSSNEGTNLYGGSGLIQSEQTSLGYSSSSSNNTKNPSQSQPNLYGGTGVLQSQQTSFDYSSSSSNTKIPSQSQPTSIPQNTNEMYTLQGSSSNYSSVDPYSTYGDIVPPVPSSTTSSNNISEYKSPPTEKKNEVSDTQHKVNNARMDIFQYFNDSTTSTTSSNDPYTNPYQTENTNSNDGDYDYNFLPPEPQYTLSSQQSTTLPLQQQDSGYGNVSSNFVTGSANSINNNNIINQTSTTTTTTQTTPENPYSEISSKPKYYFPRPRDQVPKEEESDDDEEEENVGKNLNEEERRKRVEKRRRLKNRKRKEKLLKLRKARFARLKKFRLKPLRGVFGMKLEDAVIRPYDDPIDEYDEFTCSFLPFPLFRLLRHLDNDQVLKRKGLYRTGGSVENLKEMKKLYNKGQDPDLRKYQINTCTSLVKDYFKSLPDPLIPYDLYHEFMDAALIQSERFRVEELRLSVKNLPKVNFIILKIFIEHLRKVSSFKAVNSMDENNLGIVFAPTIIRGDNETGMDVLKNTPDKIKIVSQLITDYQRIFS